MVFNLKEKKAVLNTTSLRAETTDRRPPTVSSLEIMLFEEIFTQPINSRLIHLSLDQRSGLKSTTDRRLITFYRLSLELPTKIPQQKLEKSRHLIKYVSKISYESNLLHFYRTKVWKLIRIMD